MSYVLIGIGVCIGSVLTSLYWKYFRSSDSEFNLEDFIERMREKGIYVNINIPPKK